MNLLRYLQDHHHPPITSVPLTENRASKRGKVYKRMFVEDRKSRGVFLPWLKVKSKVKPDITVAVTVNI